MRILAISPGHNSNICILNSGKIELYLKEENLTNDKFDDYPIRCLQLVYEKYKNKKIDLITYTHTESECEKFIFFKKYIEKLFSQTIITNVIVDQFTQHLSFAAHAFYMSGFKDAITLVIDSNGSIDIDDLGTKYKESESIYFSSYPDVFIPLLKTFKVDSDNISKKYVESLRKKFIFSEVIFSKIGICDLYESANSFIGRSEYDGAYSTDASLLTNVVNDIDIFDDNFTVKYDKFAQHEYVRFLERTPYIYIGEEKKVIPTVKKDNYQEAAQYINSLQSKIQEKVYSKIYSIIQGKDIKNICITGNYATNHITNSYLLEKFPDINFYFENDCDGSSSSVGLAMNAYRMHTRKMTTNTQKNKIYYPKQSKEYKVKDNQTKINCDENQLAKIIEEKNIVAYIEGDNQETGIKKIASRNLLANPTNINIKKLLDSVKLRSWYRNYPIIILEDMFPEYFNTFGRKNNENFLVSYQAKYKMIEKYSHILSNRDTCRVFSVGENHGKIYNVLNSFFELTGCPFLINTSFNLANQLTPNSKQNSLDLYSEIQKIKIIKNGIYGIYFSDEKEFITEENECFNDEKLKELFFESEIEIF